MGLFNTGYKEHAKNFDYSSISNITELRDARKELEHRIRHKETELTFQYKAIKEFFSPAAYINRLIIKLNSIENIVKCFCKGFNTVRDIIQEYNNNKS